MKHQLCDTKKHDDHHHHLYCETIRVKLLVPVLWTLSTGQSTTTQMSVLTVNTVDSSFWWLAGRWWWWQQRAAKFPFAVKTPLFESIHHTIHSNHQSYHIDPITTAQKQHKTYHWSKKSCWPCSSSNLLKKWPPRISTHKHSIPRSTLPKTVSDIVSKRW